MNVLLERVFEKIGKGVKPGGVKRLPLGTFAHLCDMVASDLNIAPPPSEFGGRGLTHVVELLRRSGEVARRIDRDPRRHLDIALQGMTEGEIRAYLDKHWRGR